ncbi:DgyrCDS2213 [Dimorphilus gyrociliatus]|uniref:DgyrCDS2213 n=1 Tax=Dimorphilus gyrociliatus TaxID=2664684 RepID=A0A7I8V9U2_9ANNE|nr:DgyrCDS2213 [Dimorphilus gyrociliatus]
MEPSNLLWEYYLEQEMNRWPTEGKHILAQYDNNSVIVYQAYKPSISDYAVKNQVFGGPDYSFKRMSWVKTNFLWMMYRSGWATKSDQERILAIRISRAAFENILSNAYTGQKEKAMETKSNIRLQWDPDHTPSGTKLNRRAIQLGLKNEALEQFAKNDIISITDITMEVRRQHQLWQTGGLESLQTPIERVYPVPEHIKQQIDMNND